MNERLLALQKQAYAYADKHTQEGDNQFAMIQLGKFAELIVAECADIAKHHVMNISTYADADFVDEQIKKHFGVEDQVENSNQEHTCPYKEEIHGDHKTLCNCDPEQTRQCSQDI